MHFRSANIGVFICLKCCGVHRSLGTHISKVTAPRLPLTYIVVTKIIKRKRQLVVDGHMCDDIFWTYEFVAHWTRMEIDFSLF
jgi:hypothetical protein